MREVDSIQGHPKLPASGLGAVLFENRAMLLRLLLARRATPDEAEDILQELHLKLETHSIRPVAEPLAYLCRMADNLLVDRRRSAAARAVREEAWMDVHFGSERDERPSAEQMLISRDELAALSAALAVLPERTLIIFRKFRIEEMPQREIAAELGISVSAVEKHLTRAYQIVVDARAKLNVDSGPRLRS